MDLLRGENSTIDKYIKSIISPSIESEDELIDEEEDETEVINRGGLNFSKNIYTRILFIIITIVAVFTTIWQLLYVSHPVLFGVPFRASHLLLMGTIFFLTTMSTSDHVWKRRLWNTFTILMILGIIAGNLYVILGYNSIWTRAGAPNQIDIYISAVLIIVTLEGGRRAAGNAFAAMGVFALLYGLFGDIIPGPFGHQGLTLSSILAGIAVPNMTGLYGFFLGLSATLITVFVFFGVFLQYLGGARFLGDFAVKVAGRIRSGPAQVAIISSGILGMMSGAAVANVAATGSFTIPLMKDVGYDKDIAGAFESVASTGGQFMPPVMGAAAFLMAQILGRSYFEIVVAAAIPAILYYITLMLTAHIQAVKYQFPKMEQKTEISLQSLILRSYFFIPIAVIVYTLYNGVAPLYAAWEGLKYLIGLFVVYQVLNYRTNVTQMSKEITIKLLQSLDSASRTMAPIALIIAEIAWVIQIFRMTGVLNQISSLLLNAAGGSLILLLIIAAVLCVLFGFGIPTTAAYLTVALIAAPALIEAGVDEIGAHLFVFYFAILSTISPPVAASCIVASGISGGSFFNTAKYALRIALPAFLLPFIWVYNPQIIANGPIFGIFVTTFSALVAIVFMVAFFENYLFTHLRAYERLLCLGLSIGLLIPNTPQVLRIIIAVVSFSLLLNQANKNWQFAISGKISRMLR